ncbi:hypothetical protein GCM10010329_69910 [Streptomyces spiroverticillatus]|uniref:Uncharacterized protein n=1 Tax=Streptomyces finlayi TaxID=67296 RepID=A0A919CBV9_9ACTN|nr:hypothetical protein [Streptomyces finlayi]GHA36776.1 hypothetical protein GCM10010329_69910 [Streptomyces spiroverticillatus]GHD01811.1 hypothetical protein GCM10010334_47880 [Streptomyces finlayi]
MRRAPYVWAALAAVCCGAVLCVVGWYGISGERFTARQVPYLASCTLPGAALLVAGAVLLAAHAGFLPLRNRVDGRLPPHGSDAYETAPGTGDGSRPANPFSDGPLVHLPGGTLVHRPDCPLVFGKPEIEPADGIPDLTPCPVCEPPAPSPGD